MRIFQDDLFKFFILQEINLKKLFDNSTFIFSPFKKFLLDFMSKLNLNLLKKPVN